MEMLYTIRTCILTRKLATKFSRTMERRKDKRRQTKIIKKFWRYKTRNIKV
jgi:hypothetical protein